jgi:hypothetical protein
MSDRPEDATAAMRAAMESKLQFKNIQYFVQRASSDITGSFESGTRQIEMPANISSGLREQYLDIFKRHDNNYISALPDFMAFINELTKNIDLPEHDPIRKDYLYFKYQERFYKWDFNVTNIMVLGIHEGICLSKTGIQYTSNTPEVKVSNISRINVVLIAKQNKKGRWYIYALDVGCICGFVIKMHNIVNVCYSNNTSRCIIMMLDTDMESILSGGSSGKEHIIKVVNEYYIPKCSTIIHIQPPVPHVGEQPAGEQPAGVQPSGEQPSGEQPAGEQPAGEQPSGEQPSGEQPAGEQPSGEQPSVEQPSGEQPAGEQPAGEQPSGEQPAGEQPAGEQPSGEQPPGDQPSSE